jgi:hypothetical protein
MGRATLLLYRSARHPAMAEAGRALEAASARQGLSLLATEDPLYRLRRTTASSLRPRRRSHRGAQRIRALMDGAGFGTQH